MYLAIDGSQICTIGVYVNAMNGNIWFRNLKQEKHDTYSTDDLLPISGSLLTTPYQLLVVVRCEVPYVDGPALIPHDEGGLIGMEAHAVHWSIDLEQPLTLLSSASVY